MGATSTHAGCAAYAYPTGSPDASGGLPTGQREQLHIDFSEDPYRV